MIRTFVAAAITVASLALLGVQFSSMTVDSGVLPTTAARGACGVTLSEANTSAASPTVRSDDVIETTRLDPTSRLFLATGSTREGTRIALAVNRDGATSSVLLPTAPAPSWTFWIVAILSKLIVYGVGALVLWRGRDDAAFFFGIASLAIAVAVHPEPSSALEGSVQFSYAVVARLCADVAAFFLYLMAERLSRQALPAGWIALARTVVVAGLTIDSASTVAFMRDVASGACVPTALDLAVRVAFMGALVAMLAVLTAAYVTSTGVARQRLKWIALSTAVGFSGVFVYLGAQIAGKPIPSYPIMNVTMVAIPVGYSYAILRHRVIDVGFAVNRAIVFTAMTTLVVIAFALLSGVIERAAVAPGAGIALQVAVALALALSFNALQKRVETAIDQIFFRRKHRAQAELARAADEAPFVTRAETLIERAVEVVRTELGAEGAAIFLADGGSGYRCAASSGAPSAQFVEADDPTFVRLRTYLTDVDLADVDGSQLGRSGCIYPLAAHGRLMGALYCAERRSREAYDPDERGAVRSLAARVSAALEALRSREFAQLARLLADGALDEEQARARARSLIAEL